MKELCSQVAQRPDGEVVQQSQSSQSSQPNPNPDHDRTGTPMMLHAHSFSSSCLHVSVPPSPNQPNQNPNQICDRSEKPEDTEHVFVDKGKTSRSHEIDEKGLHEELGSSVRSGQPERLTENIRVKQVHDGTGCPVERNSSSAHTVKEQFAPEENRDIESSNANNKFNRAINEDNVNFNIPGVPHSISETITWRQRSKI